LSAARQLALTAGRLFNDLGELLRRALLDVPVG